MNLFIAVDFSGFCVRQFCVCVESIMMHAVGY